MKASKTENRFESVVQQLKSGFQKTSINLPNLKCNVTYYNSAV